MVVWITAAVRSLRWGGVLHLLLLMLHLLLHLMLLLHLVLLLLLHLALLLLHLALLLLHLLALLFLHLALLLLLLALLFLLYALLLLLLRLTLLLLLTLLFLSTLLVLLLFTLLVLHLLLALLFLFALLVLLIYLLALLFLLLTLLILQVLLLLTLLFLLLTLLVLLILLLRALLLFKLLALLLVHVLLHALLVLHVLLLHTLLLFELLALLRVHVLLYALLIVELLALLFKLLTLLLRCVSRQRTIEPVLSGVHVVALHGGYRPRRSDDAALCRQRSCCRDHRGATAILLEELRAILHGRLPVLHLRLHGRHTLFTHSRKLLWRRRTAQTAVAAEVGDASVVDVRVVHHFYAAVVNVVVYDARLYAVHSGVVPEVIVIPVATLISVADVAEAIVDTTVEADVVSPIAVVPTVMAAIPTPPSGCPQCTDKRWRNPCAGDVVVTGGRVIPVAGRPHVVRTGRHRLFIILRQWRRSFGGSRHVGIEQGVVFVVFRGVGSLLIGVGVLVVDGLLLLGVVVNGLLLLLVVALVGRRRGVVLQRFILRVAAGLGCSLGLRRVACAIALRHGGVAYTGYLCRQHVRIGRIGRGSVAVHDWCGSVRRVAPASCQDEPERGNEYCRPVERYVLHKNPQRWSDAAKLSAVDPILHESNPVWGKGLRETISHFPTLLKCTHSALP